MVPDMAKTAGSVELDRIATDRGGNALARKLGVTSSYLSHLRHGQRSPGRSMAERIRVLLEIPADAWDRKVR